MHLQHHPCCRWPIHGKESLKHFDDEFHRRVVVVEQYDAEQRWLRRLRRSLLDYYTMLGAIRCSVLRHVEVAPSQNRSRSAARLSLKSNPLRRIGVSPMEARSGVGIERRAELKEISRNKHLRASAAAPYHVIPRRSPGACSWPAQQFGSMSSSLCRDWRGCSQTAVRRSLPCCCCWPWGSTAP